MPALPSVIESDARVPDFVLGYVSVTSQGGTSLLDAGDLSDPEAFYGSVGDQRSAGGAVSKQAAQPTPFSRAE